MASTRSMIGWARRYCSKDSSKYYDMKLYATLSWNESYDEMNVLTCSNFRCSFSRESSDNGYFANCPGEDGKAIAGSCPDDSTTYSCLSNVNGSSMSQKGSYASNKYALGSASLGSYGISGEITLDPGERTSFNYAYGGACTKSYAKVSISNPRSEPQPIPPSVSARASCSNGSYSSASFNASCNYGFCPGGTGGSSSYTVTDDDGNVIKSGSGCSVTIGTLQANTHYNVDFRIRNNCGSDSDSASVVTSTGNSLTDVTSTSFDTASVRLVPIMGGGYYKNPTHEIQVARCGYGDWKTVATSHATAPEVITFNGLTEETCYQIRCTTTNDSGCSYTSEGAQFTTPPKGICIANYTKIEPTLDINTMKCCANICYEWTAYLLPADITVYYRVKDGFDPEWQVANELTVNEYTGNYCFELCDLFPNQVVYETYIHTHTEQLDWNSDISEFTTPLVPEVKSENCASLTYMTEYLCASVKKLYSGNKKIYANPFNIALCDPYNEDPTHLTLWSRALRLCHAYLCLLCDFVNLAHATEGQYLVAEVGWTNILKEIVESQVDTDGWRLASSDAIYKYIHEKLKQVWHYQGTVDIMVEGVADLANYPSATTAIVKNENAIYRLENENWTKDTALVPEDFGVWHIEQDSDVAKAESGWYYWGGTWNNLDADLEQVEAIIKVLEEKQNYLIQNKAGQEKQIAVVDSSFDFTNVSCNKDTIYFVTEPQELPTETYYTVSFVEDDGTVLREEEVLSGALATVFTPEKPGYDFVEWQVDEERFNDSMPIIRDTVVVAVWQAQQVTLSYDINGGTGDTPPSVTGNYGMTAILPDNSGFDYDGKIFGGWEKDGVIWSDTIRIWEDTTLKAVWDSVYLTVAIRTGDGNPDRILQVEYGATLEVPPNPVRDGYDFTGWQNEDGTPFDFTQPITQNTVIVAGWVVAQVTVTFNAQTLPEGSTETVENPAPATIERGSTVTEPVVIAENYILIYWTLNGVRYNFDTPVEQNITLEAVWSEAFMVDFDTDGGEPATIPSQQVVDGGYVTKPADPTKKNCEFEGWKETATVTFNPNIEGLEARTEDVAIGTVVAEPQPPKDPNGKCLFKGWKLKEE